MHGITVQGPPIFFSMVTFNFGGPLIPVSIIPPKLTVMFPFTESILKCEKWIKLPLPIPVNKWMFDKTCLIYQHTLVLLLCPVFLID